MTTLASLDQRLTAVERRLQLKRDTTDRAIGIRDDVLRATGIALEDLLGSSRAPDLIAARLTIARIARECGCNRVTIADAIGRSVSQVSRMQHPTQQKETP